MAAIHNAIQIAGVIDGYEADLLVGLGVEFLGFPLRLRDGREDLTEHAARAIIASLPAHVSAVAITYLDRACDVLDLVDSVGANWVQLHGAIDVAEIERLHVLRPELRIIKSLIVSGDNLTQLRIEIGDHVRYVEAFITDTHDPGTGRTGATGVIHDWRISRALVEQSSKPVILAGGLNPVNVERAISDVRPAAVDVHTGVEAVDGRKDPVQVRAFVDAARAAFARVDHGRNGKR